VQLSGNLIAVLSQCLCPRIDTDGMLAGYEFMYVTPGIQNLIRENKSFRIDSEIQTGKKFGMQLLDDNLFMHYSAGRISAEECIDKSKNPGYMVDKMHKAGLDITIGDDLIAEAEAVAAESSGAAAAAAAGKPGGAPDSAAAEKERLAQIQANRERMQRAAQKK
jgi:hypothetical protein